jgi:hypothetical protein
MEDENEHDEEERGNSQARCLCHYGDTFFTKRTQFLQKSILPQLAANMDVAEIVLRKSVGFLYTKRTQFLEQGRRLNAKGKC